MAKNKDNFRDMNILFFDDKKFLLKGLQRHFNSLFTCHIATTGTEANEILLKNKIQIVVADQQMPEDAGINLLKKLRDEAPEMRKILTTSNRHGDLVLNMTRDGLTHGIVYTPLNRAVLKEELISQANILNSKS